MNKPADNRPPPRPLDLLDPRLRPLCDAHLLAGKVPGASVAVVCGDTTYHYAFGVKSLATKEPVTVDTSFNIGSCSKAFASAAVASLVADGLVDWDDPISRYVPEFQLYDPLITRQVTLRDLGSNRLGLPRTGLTEYGMDPEFPAEYVFERMRHTAPIHPFRDRFTYVNSGHACNAVAVGRITGKGFLATLRERILAPLGMTATSGGALAASDLSDLAAWHCVVDGQVVAIDPVFTDQYLGSGGMVSSGRDALQWLRLHLGGGTVDGKEIVPRDALLETHRPHSVARPGKDLISLFYPDAQMGAYALGWAVSDFEGHLMVCHSGSDLGVASMTILLPASRIGIAVYGNAIGFTPVALAYAIAANLIGLAPRDWRAYIEAAALKANGPPPVITEGEEPSDTSIYEGAYAHLADGPLLIERTDGKLRGRLPHSNRWEFTLTAAGEHRFKLRFTRPEWQMAPPSKLEFKLVDGRVAKVEMHLGLLMREFQREG